MKNVVLSKMSYWLLLVLMALPLGVYGQSVDIDGVRYTKAAQYPRAVAQVIPESKATIETAKIRDDVSLGGQPCEVRTIDDFKDCTNLKTVEIGPNVSQIGDGAFQGCTSLLEIHVNRATPPDLGSDVFDKMNANYPIYVPKEKVEVYKNAWPIYEARIVEEPTRFKIKLTAAASGGGTISGTYPNGSITQGEEKEIPEGSIIALKATPDLGYKLKTFMVGNNPIEGKTVTVNEATTISAEFEKESPTPPVPPVVWYNVRVPATQGVLFTCKNQEADSINLDVLDRGSLTFYIKLKPDYVAPAIKVTTNRGEVLLPRDSDNKYIVNNVSEDVVVKVEGVHPTGNEAINADQVKVWTSNGELHIEAPAQEKVHIVTFAGALLKQLTTTGGHTSVALAPGNYIVRVGNQSFKVNL